MACHKLGFFLEQGVGCVANLDLAVEYYKKAYDEGKKKKRIMENNSKANMLGYPDSAHNLGLIYQGFVKETAAFKDIKKSIEYFERAKQWGYSPSCNACMSIIKKKAMSNNASG